ncbi:MAG: TlpA family protein disulfide reductase [Bacteroidetes bacterium]|nr:TlpA family protein disulfide reductase [Bacteroidota bacterium]
MKKIIFIAACFLLTSFGFSQNPDSKIKKLPSITIKTVDGKTIKTSDISNNGKPIIISFWALWCKPCQKELSTIAEVYDEWQKETGVKLVAVSIDDARSSSRVLPTVNGNNWTYEVLLDVNGDFKRAMNVNMIPHTFLLNGKGEIVWQHTSFAEGSELELIELVKKLNRGEDISEKK